MPNKIKRQKRLENGYCGICGVNKVNESPTCDICKEKLRCYSKQRIKERKERKLCTTCGDSGLFFTDLERTLPAIQPGYLMQLPQEERIDELQCAREAYNKRDFGAVEEAVEEAKRLEVETSFMDKARWLCSREPRERAQVLALSGHPLAKVISDIASEAFECRTNALGLRIG